VCSSDLFAVADIDHHTGGHGLSLATARHIVEQLGGALLHDPDGATSGATFRIELPAPVVTGLVPPAVSKP